MFDITDIVDTCLVIIFKNRDIGLGKIYHRFEKQEIKAVERDGDLFVVRLSNGAVLSYLEDDDCRIEVF